jgi:hypothetical protein
MLRLLYQAMITIIQQKFSSIFRQKPTSDSVLGDETLSGWYVREFGQPRHVHMVLWVKLQPFSL